MKRADADFLATVVRDYLEKEADRHHEETFPKESSWNGCPHCCGLIRRVHGEGVISVALLQGSRELRRAAVWKAKKKAAR